MDSVGPAGQIWKEEGHRDNFKISNVKNRFGLIGNGSFIALGRNKHRNNGSSAKKRKYTWKEKEKMGCGLGLGGASIQGPEPKKNDGTAYL